MGLTALVVALATASAPTGLHFAVLGDRAGEPDDRVFQQVVQDIARLHPDFVVTVGDLVDDPEDLLDWNIASGLLEQLDMPVHVTAGNHDINRDPESVGLFRQRHGTDPDHAFEHAGVHITVINNATANSAAELTPAQLSWLERELTAARTAPLSLVFMHRPFWAEAVGAGKPDPLHQLFKRTGVDAVFTGHWHRYLYQRIDGIDYYTAGSSGGGLRGTPDLKVGNDYHFLWCHVTGGKLSVHPVRLGSLLAQDLINLDDAREMQELGGRMMTAAVEIGQGLRGTLRIEINNLTSTRIDDSLEVLPSAGWRLDLQNLSTGIDAGEVRRWRLGLHRPGDWFPLPQVRLPVTLASGRRVNLGRPVDLERRVRLRRGRGTPTIDGHIASGEWRGAVRIDEFGDAMGRPSRTDPTEILLLADRENLYLAAVCEDGQMAQQKSRPRKRDEPVYYDDRLGLMLSADKQTTYWVYVNPHGSIWDVMLRPGEEGSDRSFDAPLKVESARQDDRWTVELALPLTSLVDGKVPDKWRFAIRRVQSRKQAEALLVPGWGDDPGRFAVMELR